MRTFINFYSFIENQLIRLKTNAHHLQIIPLNFMIADDERVLNNCLILETEDLKPPYTMDGIQAGDYVKQIMTKFMITLDYLETLCEKHTQSIKDIEKEITKAILVYQVKD